MELVSAEPRLEHVTLPQVRIENVAFWRSVQTLMGQEWGQFSLCMHFALSSCEECVCLLLSLQRAGCHFHYLLPVFCWKKQEMFRSIRGNDSSDGNNWVSGKYSGILEGHHHPFLYPESLGVVGCQAKHPSTRVKNRKMKACKSKSSLIMEATCLTEVGLQTLGSKLQWSPSPFTSISPSCQDLGGKTNEVLMCKRNTISIL